MEKSDEFDECMLNRKSFPYQNFALRKSQYCIFYGYNLLTWVCQDLSCYVGTWNVEVYFRPITHKKDAPEDKDPPEGKELSNLSGHIYRKLYTHHHCDQLLATCITLT